MPRAWQNPKRNKTQGRLTMPTLRKEIAEALEKGSLDMREISKIFHIKEREALDHLQHIERSARRKRFIMEPACCLDCGFIFKKRGRLSTPSRCPLCKSLSITPPRFKIVQIRQSAGRVMATRESEKNDTGAKNNEKSDY